MGTDGRTANQAPGCIPDLTIVIPVRNEAGSLPGLFEEIKQVVESLQKSCEILIVDDHSEDATSIVVEKMVPGHFCMVRCIPSILTQGKDRALAEGFMQARGGIIITLDGDGQNDPADIPKMLKLLEKSDMVCGVRSNRQDPLLKRFVSALANRVRKSITNDSIDDAGCALRVMRTGCARYLYPQIPAMSGSAHYFFPTILKRQGCTVIQVEVNHRQRVSGTSKFRLCRGRVLSGLKACFLVRRLPAEAGH
jgi:glycosyltransferase involved in cell wall biosynthesis